METGRRGNAVQKACRKDAAMKAMPQRHRIAESAAVVGTGRRGNAVQKACRKDAAMKAMPQRHRIAEFAAVVETERTEGRSNGTNGREKQRTERRGNEQDRETMPKTENFYYFYG